MAAVGVVDFFTGHRFILHGLLGVGPLLCAIHCRPRPTALIGLLSLSLAAWLGIHEGNLLAPGHVMHFLLVVAGSAIALMFTFLRRQDSLEVKKKTAIMRLLQDVSIEASNAAGVDAALQACLDAVCLHTGWPIGHAYVRTGGAEKKTLVSSRLWSLRENPLDPENHALAVFREATERTLLVPGMELAGWVMQEKTPAWVEDISQSPLFAPASAARAAGLGAAFAFPVMEGGETVAVLEFFTGKPVKPDPDLLAVMFHLDVLLVRVFERERGRAAIADSEYKFRAVAESSADAIIIVNGLGRVTFWNPRAETMFGYSSDMAMGRELTFILPPDHHAFYNTAHALFLAMGKAAIFARVIEIEALRRDGGVFLVELSLSGWLIEGKQYFSGSIRDISERTNALALQRDLNARLRRSAEALRISNQELQLLGEITGQMYIGDSPEEICDLAGRYGEPLMPHCAGALFIRDNPRGLLQARAVWGPAANPQAGFSAGDCWALRLGRPYLAERGRPELRCAHVAGTPAATLCIPMFDEDEPCGVYFWQDPGAGAGVPLANRQPLLVTLAGQVAIVLRDLRLKELLQKQSMRDPLTGLFNRRYMEESLERELQRAWRRGRPLALVMFDLDHFKRFNDTLGHPAGDALLRELSGALAECTRSEDVLCRYGGDEFLLIMPEAGGSDAIHSAELLGQACKRLLSALGHPGGDVTVSFGVAAFPQHGTTPAGLIAAADAALYRAKAEGRDRVRLADAPSFSPAPASPRHISRTTGGNIPPPARPAREEKN